MKKRNSALMRPTALKAIIMETRAVKIVRCWLKGGHCSWWVFQNSIEVSQCSRGTVHSSGVLHCYSSTIPVFERSVGSAEVRYVRVFEIWRSNTPMRHFVCRPASAGCGVWTLDFWTSGLLDKGPRSTCDRSCSESASHHNTAHSTL